MSGQDYTQTRTNNVWCGLYAEYDTNKGRMLEEEGILYRHVSFFLLSNKHADVSAPTHTDVTRTALILTWAEELGATMPLN